MSWRIRSRAWTLPVSGSRVRPYAQRLLGFSYAYTRTSVDLGYDGGSEGTTHLGDFAPSFGAGGGVTIGLASWSEGRVGLDIGLRYLTGGEVEYLTRGDLQRDASGVKFEPTRSRTTLFGLQLGVNVDFWTAWSEVSYVWMLFPCEAHSSGCGRGHRWTGDRVHSAAGGLNVGC